MDYPVLGHFDPTVEPAEPHISGEEEQELLCKYPGPSHHTCFFRAPRQIAAVGIVIQLG